MKRVRLGNMISDVNGVSLAYAAVAKDARATRRGTQDQNTVLMAYNEVVISTVKSEALS